MPRARFLVFMILAALLLSATAALAGDAEADKPKSLDGKELFKLHCKSCHGAKSEHGEFTPMTLIQEQWEEIFAGTWAETHAAVAAPADAAKKLPEVLDAATLEAIRKFCVDHAADSEQPMTCG